MAQTNIVTTFAPSIPTSVATQAYQPTTVILKLSPVRAEKALRLLQACGAGNYLADGGGTPVNSIHKVFYAFLDAIPAHSQAMPSLFADIFDNFAIPVLSDQLGESVSWYALAVMTNPAVPVTAIFVELEALDDTHRGKENLRKAELTVLDGTLIDTRDAFIVNNENWQVRAVRKGTDGLLVCDLERHDMEVRNGGGGRLL